MRYSREWPRYVANVVTNSIKNRRTHYSFKSPSKYSTVTHFSTIYSICILSCSNLQTKQLISPLACRDADTFGAKQMPPPPRTSDAACRTGKCMQPSVVQPATVSISLANFFLFCFKEKMRKMRFIVDRTFFGFFTDTPCTKRLINFIAWQDNARKHFFFWSCCHIYHRLLLSCCCITCVKWACLSRTCNLCNSWIELDTKWNPIVLVLNDRYSAFVGQTGSRMK